MMIQAPLKEIPGAFSTPKMKPMPGKGMRRGRKQSDNPNNGRKPPSSSPISQSTGTVIAGKAAIPVGEKRQRSAPINIGSPGGPRKPGRSSPAKKVQANSPRDPRASSPPNYAGAKFSESPSANELPPPPILWMLDTMVDNCPKTVVVVCS